MTNAQPAEESGLLSPRTLMVRGWSCHTFEGGGGERPIVLLHGLGVSSRFIQPAAQALAREWPVLAPDLPGFGESEGPAGMMEVDDLGDWTAEFIAASGAGEVRLCGLSFGCQVAASCAARHPGLIHKLILAAPSPAPQDRDALRLLRLWRKHSGQEPSDLKLLLSEYGRAGFGRVAAAFNTLRRYPLEDDLPKIEAPTLVVRGEKDVLSPASWAEEVTRLLPRGEVRTIPGATHTLGRLWGDELAEAVRPFLRDRA